ncbi:MAG TPA: exodeoxyribonuclease VII large subunit [Chthoniobacterales bacterium]|nr:exodeoxyribonuclease VII large subunit [Chthoniobacterales bacterium]
MQRTPDLFQQTSRVLTVSELTRSIRGALETRFGAVWVQGEVSNYKAHSNGHQYFTLKDARTQIACVIWRDAMAPLREPLADGARIQIFGTVSVYEARGQYQIAVQIVQPFGRGALQAKFEALKRKLDAEGLFAPERKRSLPKFPKRIGIVTSPSGAAIRDLLNIFQRRAPWLQILINPVRVQGAGAAQEIAVAIRELATPNESFAPVDLIVVARGGGSMEDLWEFNEEIVARTIVSINLPVVSAVGHEVDFTICDFVADLRAPTPSAAAELIVPDIVDLRRRIDSLAGALGKCLRSFVEHQKTRLRFLSERALARELVNRLRNGQQQIDLARDSLHRFARQKFDHCQQTLQRFEAILRVLGPEATLQRGYSITTDARGKLIRSVKLVRPKMKIRTRVSDGEFESAAL